MTGALPFPVQPADEPIRAGNLALAPDGTVYLVPSGMHERLCRAAFDGTDAPARDPSVALALAGWVLVRTDGLTDRVAVDGPDDPTAHGLARRRVDLLVREFAAAHDAGSVALARHPSGGTRRWSRPARFAFPRP